MKYKENIFNNNQQPDENAALIGKEHHSYSTNDVMNMTFNRSSLAIPGFLLASNESPKQSEFPYDFYDIEKKDSLKLSSGEF